MIIQNLIIYNFTELSKIFEELNLDLKFKITFIQTRASLDEKIDKLDKQINSLKNKLKNKLYLKNAPKDIVQNDKKLLKELTIEDNKLRSIVSSIN